MSHNKDSNERLKACKGCSVAVNCYMRTWYKTDGVKMICPCRTCLVKTMCKKECNLIREYGSFIPEPLYCDNSEKFKHFLKG